VQDITRAQMPLSERPRRSSPPSVTAPWRDADAQRHPNQFVIVPLRCLPRRPAHLSWALTAWCGRLLLVM
jgi:hypothetical protein